MKHKAYWAIMTLNFDLKAAGEQRFLQLNGLGELMLEAYGSSYIYKGRTKKWHNKHIMKRRFEKDDKILLFNSRLRLFPGRRKSRWSGPFKITKVQPNGIVKIWSESTNAFTFNVQ